MATIKNPSNSNEVFTTYVDVEDYDCIRICGSLTTSSGSSESVGNRYIYLELYGNNGDFIDEWIVSAQTSGSAFYFPGPSSSTYEYIYGLSPETTYQWYATIAWGTNSSSLSSWAVLSGSVTTPQRITANQWSWTSSNGFATATQTQNAYAILQGTRQADDFSHLVWNDLVDKIVETRDARKDIAVSWDNAYATLEKTKVSAGNTLSAVRYNSIRYNINNMKGVSAPYVSSGEVILGQHIISLVETLNKIIGEL